MGQETESSTNEESENEPDEASFDVDLNDDSGGEFIRCTTSEENGAFNEHVDFGESDDVGSGGGSSGHSKLVETTAHNTSVENSVENLNHEKDIRQRHVVDPDNFSQETTVVSPTPSRDHLLSILRANLLNWFAFAAELEELLHGYCCEVFERAFLEFSEFLPWSDLSDHEEKLVEQSRQAYLQVQRDTINSNLAGDICTDSESDDPEAWVGVHDVLSP